MIKIPADMTQALVEMDWHRPDQLRTEIGGFFERVRIGDSTQQPPVPFEKVIMLVDEDGTFKPLTHKMNIRASLLYGYQIHGQPIVGDVVIVGEDWVTNDEDGPGIDFVELPEDKRLEFWNDFFRAHLVTL
jgi:hypothetical protein